MPMFEYAGACLRFERELISSLSDSDIENLRIDCVKLAQRGWLDWTFENEKNIREYVSAAPSYRARAAKWRDPVLRRRLVLASFQHIHRAFLLLDGIRRYMISPGGSYRDMARDAGSAYFDIVYLQEMIYWPFRPPAPFDEWINDEDRD
jgi:hypothetical protein